MLAFQEARQEELSERRTSTDSTNSHPLQGAQTMGAAAFGKIKSGFSRLDHLNTSVRRSASCSSVPAGATSSATSTSATALPRKMTAEERARENNEVVERELLLWETEPLAQIHDLDDLTSFWAVSTPKTPEQRITQEHYLTGQ